MIWFISSVLCTILTFLVCLEFYLKKCTTYGLAKSIQGPHMYPLIGAIDFLYSPQHKTFETVKEYSKKYANGFTYWSFGLFSYCVYSAEGLEQILTSPKHIEKSLIYKILHNLLGFGLLTSSGDKWFKRRKLLTPAFHFNILNGFQRTFTENTELLIATIRQMELDRPGGTNLQQLISRFTLNTICGRLNLLDRFKAEIPEYLLTILESAMGVKISKIDELDDYRRQINRIGKVQVERMCVPWFFADWIYRIFGKEKLEKKYVQEAHAFTRNVIDTKRKSFNADQDRNEMISINDERENIYEKKRSAMLDTLLLAERNGGHIDANGIQEEVDTFVFEGFDTTMTAITFILLLIANHSDEQQKLYDEIVSVANKRDYYNLKYLDAVIKECMRLYPPVPFIGRVLGEETEIDNVKFPAKTMIHILIFALHRDPRYFENPDKFDPNRFLSGEYQNGTKHPFAYVPFSAGQRNCIGQKFAMMELKTAIGEIIRNFELRPITRPNEIVIISDLILRSKYPIYIQFVSRQNLY